jgi:glycosyltransferase involved in cell wall biosynthesis
MTRPLRILQVTDLFEPFIGGMEEHVKTLSQGLVRRGHEVTVATTRLPGTAADDVTSGVRIRRIASWSSLVLAPWYDQAAAPYHPPVPDPGVVTQLQRLVSELHPDVVHAQGWITYSCLAGLAHRPFPLVVTIHDYGFACAVKTLIRNGHGICPGPAPATCLRCAAREYGTGKGVALTAGLRAARLLHGRADSWVAVSQAAADSNRVALPRGCQITVIPPASASLPGPQAASRRPSWLPANDYLLFVGALERFKGLHWLLDTYAAGRFSEPLVLVGRSRTDTPQTWPAGVVVQRNVPHQEVMQAWAHARIGVVPSLGPETFGLTAMEAMRSGVPVVASRIGALPGLVLDGVTGLLVTPGDTPGLLAAIRLLNGDPALRRRMGAAGQARAEQFSATAVTAMYENHYRQLLAARAAAG